MRQAAYRHVDHALLRLGEQVLHALELALAQCEHHAVVDVGTAEVLEVLGKAVVGLLQRVHDHLRPHVAEEQVVGVLVALVHEGLVADLAGGARVEAVLEVGLKQLPPHLVERAGQALGATALAGGDDHADVLGRIGLRAQPRRAKSKRCSGPGKQPAARWVVMVHSYPPRKVAILE
jgi:hypothetical protein